MKYVCLSQRERQAINARKKKVLSVLFIFKAKIYSWKFLKFYIHIVYKQVLLSNARNTLGGFTYFKKI